MPTNLYYKVETTAGTWVAPDATAGETESFSVNPGESRITRRSTGLSRAAVGHDQGVHTPSGNWTQRLDYVNARLALGAVGFAKLASTQADSSIAYDHVYAPDDDAIVPGYSVQAQQVREATTESVNVRGLAIDQLTLSNAVDAYAMAEASWLAYEVVRDAETFLNGNASSANLTIAYPTPLRLFRFSDLTATTGGTVAIDGTSKVVSVSGSSALTNLENVSVQIATGKVQRTILGQRTPASIINGDRTVTVSFDIRNDAPNVAWLGHLLSGDSVALILKWAAPANSIATGYTYELEVAIPSFHVTTAPPGDVELGQGAKTISISGIAEYNTTAATDISVRVRNTATS